MRPDVNSSAAFLITDTSSAFDMNRLETLYSTRMNCTNLAIFYIKEKELRFAVSKKKDASILAK